jgi:transcriptional regulator with GAF, ATPase, and Fis domain
LDAEMRERRLTRAFVELADSLVTGFDVADLLHDLVARATDILAVDVAGLLLSDQQGNLRLLASSTEATRMLELYQLQSAEGPCLDCFRAGKPVLVPDLASASDRWPRFVAAAQEQGYAAVHALPMRLREKVVGALSLFSFHRGSLPLEDVRAGQALADVATIGILQERAARHSEMVMEQIQGALSDRYIVEQAKGVLAAHGPEMEVTFQLLRGFAQANRLRIVEVSRSLVNGRLKAASIISLDAEA